jgi:hypothetical protein
MQGTFDYSPQHLPSGISIMPSKLPAINSKFNSLPALDSTPMFEYVDLGYEYNMPGNSIDSMQLAASVVLKQLIRRRDTRAPHFDVKGNLIGFIEVGENDYENYNVAHAIDSKFFRDNPTLVRDFLFRTPKLARILTSGDYRFGDSLLNMVLVPVNFHEAMNSQETLALKKAYMDKFKTYLNGHPVPLDFIVAETRAGRFYTDPTISLKLMAIAIYSTTVMPAKIIRNFCHGDRDLLAWITNEIEIAKSVLSEIRGCVSPRFYEDMKSLYISRIEM